jgi:glutathione peroxidase
VNVASKCGSPAVRAARGAAATYGERGLQVIGFPCNQFMGQEPGSMDEILEYCSVTYGVTSRSWRRSA